MVEEILNNGNIVLRDWNVNEIEETSVPPQQLKNIYLDDMRMDDFETSFKKCKINEEISKNDTVTGSANISLTTTPNTIKEDDTSVINMNFKMTCTPTTSTDEVCTKQHGMTVNMTKDDVQSVSLTTTLTTTPTTTPITIQNTEVDMGTNVYTTSTPTYSPINNEDDCGVNSLITTLTSIVNHKKCMNTNPISSQQGGTELFLITNMTNSPIAIMIPSESSVYEDNTLPDLTQEQDIRTGNYMDISDEERTFMDDEVQRENDCVILHGEPSPILKFSPLNSASGEECRPLVNILDCGIIPYTNIGEDLKGKPTHVYRVVGDGNCYFRCISYVLSGKEDYHRDVRNVLCEYISWFPGRLCML